MGEVNWTDLPTLPKKEGRYLVEFYFPLRHPTDRVELAFREFKNGTWDNPHYNGKNDGGQIVAWKPISESEECDCCGEK